MGGWSANGLAYYWFRRFGTSDIHVDIPLFGWMVVYCFTFETISSPLSVKVCINLKAHAWHYRKRSLTCHTCCDMGHRFLWSSEGWSISHLIRQARGYYGPILTRIPTGSHIFEAVASISWVLQHCKEIHVYASTSY